MFTLPEIKTKTKPDIYKILEENVRTLFDGETDYIANAANLSALIYHTLGYLNWAGFYFYKDDQLVLGPFQGKPACIRIDIGQGVCGTAAQTKKTQIIADVHKFPGHIACDSASRSEIVVPVIKNNSLLGVLDLDSPLHGSFDQHDQTGLEKIVQIYCQASVFSLSHYFGES